MGETSKYFVPTDQESLLGRESEIVEKFWSVGVFLATLDNRIMHRIRDWKERGQPLPEWHHCFTFAAMGLGGSLIGEPVPNQIYDLSCPRCHSGVMDEAYEAWQDDTSDIPTSERTITCPHCGASSESSDLVAPDTPFTFARIYFWVSDVEESDWDTTFKETVESILGPCREYTSWET